MRVQILNRSLVLGLSCAAALACAAKDPKNPGIDVGGEGVKWASKNAEQKIAFMAGRFQPKMKQLFVGYHEAYEDFSCGTCHGQQAELVDYEMPADIYPLPEENTIAASKDYDEDATAFMQKEVMPACKDLFNRGEGTQTQVTCFTCHPAE